MGADLRVRAYAILSVLTVINFLNYLDRYVLSAVLEGVREELVLVDAESGFLGTAFMIVYTVLAPLGGYLGDRWRRNVMVAIAVGLWSLATVATGYAEDYPTLLTMRALVGVGEAGYATVAPAIIADLFRPSERGRKLAWFYLAIPMGSALGYVVGGAVGEAWGWRSAFYVAGAPGLVMAVVAALLPDPKRGGLDDEPPPAKYDLVEAARRIFRSPAWRYTTVGMTLMTFAMGGIAFWMPTFLKRQLDLSLGEAATTFGAVTVVAGLIGTLVGGYIGDRANARHKGGYLSVSGIGLLIGAPLVLAMPFMPSLTGVLVLAFVAELLLFLNTGPLNAALVACVPAAFRASAVAVNVFFIHALGDAVSPYLMGLLSDDWGLALAIATTALPIAVGGVILIWGAREVDRRPEGLAAVDTG